ncbi:UNVERIFIED_CONTAM: Cell division control protein 48B [Sesamum calycinum]|uniref:Cell division control protein 48B n=1 Tax=Sesamum calycinum TaxID=2727403 RepID=A0AAW2QXM2_9LAMI
METSSGASNDCGGAAAWKAEEAIAGNTEALQALRELISYPILYSRESRILGLKWPCGLLLYGPPGTGKTSLVRAVVRECDAHLIVIRVDAIDPALRRAGRFDAEVEVSTPNEYERCQILKLYTKKLPLDPGVDLEAIAASCKGYVGADIEALCREATMSALSKSSDVHQDGGNCLITIDDWKHARSVVGPSITRGVTVEIPKVSWEDIGGLKDLKKKLQQAVEWPLKHSSAFSRLGVSPIRGILLHGPPGCSKTTLAKAAACAAQAFFFSLSGAELYSMYVGEGEALLRNTFRKASLAAPGIIFFDEADVVAAKRGGSSSGSSIVGERLLSTLLTEMDGLEQAKGILVLAATNRPHAIDAALMRPGRFDLVLYVPPPDLEARCEILRVHTRNMKVDGDVDLQQIAQDTELFTGAELEGLCREAGIVALREDISATVVCNRHFQTVMRSLRPALTREEIESYASFLKNPNLRPNILREPSSKLKSKGGNKSIFRSAAPVAVGAISLILYGVVKYISHQIDTTYTELART